MLERINRAVADCLILCAYSQKHPLEAAGAYVQSLRDDPLWDDPDVDVVESLVSGVLTKLQRNSIDAEGWLS